MMNKKINCLYSHFKNIPKKLKIVCDWDEVIQPHEPYALWLTIPCSAGQKKDGKSFQQFFKDFWERGSSVEYSPFGSRLTLNNLENSISNYTIFVRQKEIKNSADFYQKSPFLTIAKELLMLIKENKIEQVIFLSAYDKRVFPKGDERKYQIFKETFGKFANCSLELVGFDSEMKGINKSMWISKNVPDVDVVIDDNPIICGNIVCIPEVFKNKVIIFAPYYPEVASQHQERVLLIEASVSDLKKEDFDVEIKKECSDCKKLDYLEICDECKGDLCMRCLSLYQGSEYLFCQSCFNKKTEKEKAVMRDEKKGKIKLRRDNELKRSKYE